MNPIIGIRLSKRFVIAMDTCADVMEYMDHVINFENTKDSLLFLLIATIFLYLGQIIFILLPILFILKILHNSTTNAAWKKRELDFQHSYGAIQKVMRITSDAIELYDVFMKEYVYWGNKEKALQLIIELIKLTLCGIIV